MNTEDTLVPPQDYDDLFAALNARFAQNMQRHPGLDWAKIQARLEQHPTKLWSLDQMEQTGGEPDVVGFDPATDAYLVVDCASESPVGRRSLCYDQAALSARKAAKPQSSAVEMARAMGLDLLTEAQYRALQTLGAFDLKTSSWIATPAAIRTLGGALFCDRRYDTVFVYHNGAQSYYASRGFRGLLTL